MEEYNIYFKKFKVAIGILAAALLIIIILIARIVPQIQEIGTINEQYTTQTSALEDAERKLKSLKEDAVKKELSSQDIVKAFYKPISMGLDTEAAIAEEFGEILQLMRENKIKTRAIKYDYDPQDDNFVKFVASKYHVCRVTGDMIASYDSFENFLRDLYKHEHFLELEKIEILPYEKNKRILLINFQLKLYAQKAG